MTRSAAVLITDGGGAVARCRAAVEGQTAAVAAVVVAGDPAAGIAECLETGCEAVWILDGAPVPAPDALELLLGAGGAVRCGMVLDALGRPCAGAEPRIAERAVAEMAASVASGVVPLRHAPLAHALVEAGRARTVPFPRASDYGAQAGHVWTTRLLRGELGSWVTRSVATAEPCTAAAPPSPRVGVRLLRSGTWTVNEAVDQAVKRVGRR